MPGHIRVLLHAHSGRYPGAGPGSPVPRMTHGEVPAVGRLRATAAGWMADWHRGKRASPGRTRAGIRRKVCGEN